MYECNNFFLSMHQMVNILEYFYFGTTALRKKFFINICIKFFCGHILIQFIYTEKKTTSTVFPFTPLVIMIS